MNALFALAQLMHNLLHLRRNPRSWLVFRAALGFTGAALVVLPLSLWNSWFVAIVGLAMFTAAILLPPAKIGTTADRKARELGALFIVNGVKYHPGNAPAAPVHIFFGTDNIFPLDPPFQ